MAVRPRRPWTVLIYMVADDPQGGEMLDQQAVQEMDEITKAALVVNQQEKNPDQLYVALQIDFRTLPGVWRRVIGESTFVSPESNAADPSTLYGFFEWAANECPAERYLLIFWGHSRAQFGMFGDSNRFEYTAQTLTLDELREALTAAKRSMHKAVDIIAFKDCFMATLETAYEMSGLADYLLASQGLVPVVGWPYEKMFEALASGGGGALDKAKLLLGALKDHYQKPANLGRQDEVPYSLLSTAGATAVVGTLRQLVGKGRKPGMNLSQADLRPALDNAAKVSGDPALVDLGLLMPSEEGPLTAMAETMAGKDAGAAQRGMAANGFKELAGALGNVQPGLPDGHGPAASEKLVIDHTGKTFGGVSVFVYPSSPKAVRESQLTRLADEKAYRRLAISTDTNWADIALQEMPVRPTQSGPDISAAIALLEQLQRIGSGMAPGVAAAASLNLRSLAWRARSQNLTDSEINQAAEYAAIAELAARLATFAADKGGAEFGPKGGAEFFGKDKGGAEFGPKGGAEFGPKGGAEFGPIG